MAGIRKSHLSDTASTRAIGVIVAGHFLWAMLTSSHKPVKVPIPKVLLGTLSLLNDRIIVEVGLQVK